MIELLIKRTDGDWFDLPADSNPYRPKTVPFEPVGGDGGRILIGECEVSFSYEDPRIQISFEDDIAEDLAEHVATEVLERVRELTGQQADLLRIT